MSGGTGGLGSWDVKFTPHSGESVDVPGVAGIEFLGCDAAVPGSPPGSIAVIVKTTSAFAGPPEGVLSGSLADGAGAGVRYRFSLLNATFRGRDGRGLVFSGEPPEGPAGPL